MKRIGKSIFTVTAVLFLMGCEDYLVHNHPTAVTDETWWNTEGNARAALDAVYVGVPDGSVGRQVQFLDALSDNVVARQSSRGEYESYAKGTQGANWDVSLHIWRDDFKTIRRANRYLENVEKVFMDEDLKKRYKYEARALRAYYHMELLMLFGGVPIVTSSVPPNDSQLARDTEQDVYDFIISELTESANNLPSEYNFQERTRISAGICWALISRLALFYGDFETAKKATKKVIDMGEYDLYPDYEGLFKYSGEENNERIFFRVNGSSYAWMTFAPQSVGGKTVLSPTASVVNSYETKQGKTIQELGPDSLEIYKSNANYNNNRDPRLKASVLWPGQTFASSVLNPFNDSPGNLNKIGIQYSTSTGYWIYKYLDPLDRSGARSLDYMIIRYAEVLLNYVEALVETGEWNHPDVYIYLNEIRNRAGMPDVDLTVYDTQEKMRELVRRERRVELAFEAVRYFDIRRYGIFEQVMNGPVFGAVDPETGEQVLVEERVASEARDFYWPIPQDEILANPNMKQNPNY